MGHRVLTSSVIEPWVNFKVVFFFGAGTWHDGLPFFVTEYCSRGSLRGLLDVPQNAIDAARAVKFALDAACGMLFLHTRSPPRMHRDLKAANLLVSEEYGPTRAGMTTK
jgi:serine/threonine protein kinase|eukprot:m.222828 g.222828  ORF g.222828 m.222828 type:complete len:109 (+) comp25835_c0_seq3:3935-4261(+)